MAENKDLNPENRLDMVAIKEPWQPTYLLAALLALLSLVIAVNAFTPSAHGFNANQSQNNLTNGLGGVAPAPATPYMSPPDTSTPDTSTTDPNIPGGGLPTPSDTSGAAPT